MEGRVFQAKTCMCKPMEERETTVHGNVHYGDIVFRVTCTGKLRGKSGEGGGDYGEKGQSRTGLAELCGFYLERSEISRGYHMGKGRYQVQILEKALVTGCRPGQRLFKFII